MRLRISNGDSGKTEFCFYYAIISLLSEVKVTFLMGDDRVPYTKVIAAPNAKQATECTFAVIGSRHNLKRRYIKVDAVKVITDE